MDETIQVTPTEKKILDCVNAAIDENREITIDEVSKITGSSKDSIYTMLSKKGGLYSRVPGLRIIIGKDPPPKRVDFNIVKIRDAAQGNRKGE